MLGPRGEKGVPGINGRRGLPGNDVRIQVHMYSIQHTGFCVYSRWDKYITCVYNPWSTEILLFVVHVKILYSKLYV